jgi:hypothetical protein
MPTTQNYGWFLLFAAIVIGGAVAWQMTRRRSGSSTEPSPGEPTPAV